MIKAQYNIKKYIIQFLMLSLGLILFLDGFLLILQKRIHLGTLLPFTIGVALCLHGYSYEKIINFLNQTQNQSFKKVWKMCWCLFLIWVMSVVIFFIYLKLNSQNTQPTNNTQAIIVLGSGLIKGKPSPTLAARLDTAAISASLHPQALIIVTGGLGIVENLTEAEVMSDYLQKKYNINASQITLEDQSTSTELNLKNSQPILKAHHLTLNSPINIVTSDFHTLRAAAIARKQGYRNITMLSAETPLMTRYNAWLREYFAYISGWVLGEF